MSMGAYDDEEHERRERKNNEVAISDDDDRTEYRGAVDYESGESTEDLLDKFKEINA